MTIKEAIAHEKRISKLNDVYGFENNVNYHKQIVEWLEELKALRNGLNIKCDNLNEVLENVKNIGYNKAIDDFAEKLKARSIKVSTVKGNTYLKAVGTNEIDKIAQQMKER